MSGNMDETNSSKRGNPGLESLRIRAKLNRKSMAHATGVTARMWQRYENEGRLPEKVETLIRIAVLAETSLDEAARMIGYQMPSKDDLLSPNESA
jgi:transcriptional regulator with XRE-family HTH domain